MKNDLPVTIKRVDYTAAAHRVESIDLTLELDPLATTVIAVSQVRRNPAGPQGPLRLDAVGLDVLALSIDGEALAVDLTAGGQWFGESFSGTQGGASGTIGFTMVFDAPGTYTIDVSGQWQA